jgi:hypothetical protein
MGAETISVYAVCDFRITPLGSGGSKLYAKLQFAYNSGLPPAST